jgi:hypothetical protein
MINLPPEARQSPFGVEQGHVIQQLGCFADAEASRFEHIMSNGIRLNYEEFGSGPTLLLLNGPMQNLCLTEDMRQHLHHNFRCIVVDLPGFGGTIVTCPPTFIQLRLEPRRHFRPHGQVKQGAA